jgi:hypothetical protein
MEKLLKKGHSSIISQLHSIHIVETPSMHPDLQSILSQHQAVFQTPQGLHLSRDDHGHFIHLILGIIPPNFLPYHHPFSQKNEVYKIVQEFLEVGVIHPSTSPYSCLIVMVLKKEGTRHISPDFCVLNKLTIKDKFPILVIYDLLDEINGAQYFTKFDLHYGYH